MNFQLEKFCVFQNEGSLKDAIALIELNKCRCVFAVTKDFKLVGSISEGDIIRFLLKGNDIHSSVNNCVNSSVLFVESKESLEQDDDRAFNLIKVHNLSAIPIVSSDLEMLRVVSMQEFLKNSEIKK